MINSQGEEDNSSVMKITLTQQGFSLMELLIVLLLLSIVLGFLLPVWKAIEVRMAEQQSIFAVIRMCHAARQWAIIQSTPVEIQVDPVYHVMTFAEKVSEQWRVANVQLIQGNELVWNGLEPVISFTAEGYSNSNGTLLFQYANGRPVYKIIISQSGRIRLAS